MQHYIRQLRFSHKVAYHETTGWLFPKQKVLTIPCCQVSLDNRLELYLQCLLGPAWRSGLCCACWGTPACLAETALEHPSLGLSSEVFWQTPQPANKQCSCHNQIPHDNIQWSILHNVAFLCNFLGSTDYRHWVINTHSTATAGDSTQYHVLFILYSYLVIFDMNNIKLTGFSAGLVATFTMTFVLNIYEEKNTWKTKKYPIAGQKIFLRI